MIQYYTIEDRKIVVSEPERAVVFLILNPTEEERKTLIGREHLDEHTLQSALDPDEISRIEFETDHVALIVKKPKSYSSDDMFKFQVSSMGIFLFDNKILIVSDTDIPFAAEKRFAKITSLKSLLLKLLGYCIYHFMEHLRIINQISDDLENKINQSMENKYLIFMFSLSKGLVYYLNAINSNGMLLQRLTNTQKIQLNELEKEMVEDLSIDNSQCYRIAEIYSNILSSMMDARASIVSNNLNILMKTLNIITIAIMVPTFVVSAFSMNVPIPFSGLGYAFYGILLLAAISVAGFFAFWRYKKW
ncbi:MAG: magnesium transporter CorA family protein [Thermodesulfobacteriota bacterium]